MSEPTPPLQMPRQEKQRKQGRGKPWLKRGEQRQAPKKKDPTEIPILRYGPSNNFLKFKESISFAALKEFGDLGHLIEQGNYYTGAPPGETAFDFTNDPYL
jgi:hypothetical protein